MLIMNVLYQHLTKKLYKDEEFDFDELSQRDRRSKRIGRRKNVNSKQMCVSSQNQNVRRWRYRSGYTYLLFGETVRAGLVRAGRAAILHGDSTLWERSIKYHKCPTFDTKRRRFQTQLIDSPKQMIQIQRCR
jgi:hypothetical protein